MLEVAELEAGLAVLGILLGYLVGSIPFAYIALRLAKGTDIRNAGSGNVGALNAYQQLGLAMGVLIMVADVSKGVFAVFLPRWIGAPDWASYGSAFTVVIGHTWPVFLNFRGGKGASTILGVGLALAPPLAAIGLGAALVVLLGTRNMVVAAVLGFVVFNTLTIAMGEPWPLIAVCLGLTVGVIGNYVGKTYRQMVTAIRQRRWRSMVFLD